MCVLVLLWLLLLLLLLLLFVFCCRRQQHCRVVPRLKIIPFSCGPLVSDIAIAACGEDRHPRDAEMLRQPLHNPIDPTHHARDQRRQREGASPMAPFLKAPPVRDDGHEQQRTDKATQHSWLQQPDRRRRVGITVCVGTLMRGVGSNGGGLTFFLFDELKVDIEIGSKSHGWRKAWPRRGQT